MKREAVPDVSAGNSLDLKTSGESDFAEQVSKLVSAKTQLSTQDQPQLDIRESTKAPTPAGASFERAGSPGPTLPGAPELRNARFIQSPSRSEMRIDLHSQDFGAISVHSTLRRDSVSTQITLEDTQLGTALTTHVHEMEQKLTKEHGLRASVSVNAQDSGTPSSDRQQQEATSTLKRVPLQSRKQVQDGSLAPVNLSGNYVTTTSTQPPAWAGNQVDLRI